MEGTWFASGTWHVRAGQADAFVERWQEMLQWTRDHHPDLELARLIRSDADDHRFVSLAAWRSAEARDAWKRSEGFATHVRACRVLCDDFQGGDFAVVGGV